MTYQIETQDAFGNWTDQGLGTGDNEFATTEEAEAMIEQLRTIGDDWADATYRVVEVAHA